MPFLSSARLRRLRSHSLEALESRIAPATVVLPSGGGPYTLAVDQADSHLHITNGSGAEIFDQGTTIGDDLTITGVGAGDQLDIKAAGGNVAFSGTLSVNINGPIHVDAGLSAVTGISLVSTVFSITSSASIQCTTGSLSMQAANGMALNASVSAGGAVSLNGDADNNGIGGFTSTAAPISSVGSTIDVTGNSITLGGTLTTTGKSITLSADTMDLSANISAGIGVVTLKQHSNTRPISVGSEIASSLSLTDSELNRVSATTLAIGDSNSASIDINSVISPANYLNLSLEHSASFTSTGGFVTDITSASVYEKIINKVGLTINSSSVLTVNTVAGFVPARSDNFTIIDTISTNTISGVFAGKPEQGIVQVGGVNKTVTYVGGGNDFILQAVPTLSASFANGTLSISETGNTGGSHITVGHVGAAFVLTADDELFSDPGNGTSFANGGRTLFIPDPLISNGLHFTLANGGNILTVNFSSGNAIPVGNIVFDATGGGVSDKLEILGGIQGNLTQTYSSVDDGAVVMSAYGRVDFTGVEFVKDAGSFTDAVFNLPFGPANSATLGDDGTAGNGLTRLSGANFATSDFQNPTGSVTIVGGNAGDTVIVGALPDLTSGLSFASLNAATFTGAISLGAGKSLSVFANDAINLTAGAQLALRGSGGLGLTTLKQIGMATGASITAEDGFVSIASFGTAAGNYAGINFNGSILTTGAGDISLVGGGGNSGTGNHGIALAGQITNLGSGYINLEGHGGAGTNDNTGLVLAAGSLTTANGNIVLQGSPGGDAGTSLGIDLGIAVQSGRNVAITTDAGLKFAAGASVTAALNVSIAPVTSGKTIDIGTYQRTTLGISDAMLDAIASTDISIGSPQTGAITVSADITSALSLKLASAAGLTGSGAVTLAAGKDLFSQTGGNVNLSGSIVVPGFTRLIGIGGAPIDVTLTNSGNDFAFVDVQAARNVNLLDNSGFQLSIGASALIRLESAGTISQFGPLDGGAALMKAGQGTLQLSQANSIGNTTITAGTILFSTAGALGSGTITLGDFDTGADVSLLAVPGAQGVSLPNDIVVPDLPNGTVATLGTVAAATGHLSLSGSLSLGSPTVFSSASGAPEGNSDIFVDGVISGQVNQITIVGGKRVTFGGANTFVGNVQLVGAGTILELAGASDVIPDASNVALGANTLLRIANTSGKESINKLTGSGSVSTDPFPFGSPQTLTVGANDGSFIFDGDFTESSGALSVTKAGVGTAAFTADSTFTGATVIAGGTLSFINPDSANLFANSRSIEMQAGTFLDVTGLGNGNAPQTLVLSSAQHFLGSGTIAGSLGGDGFIEPGSSATPGKLTISGNLNPAGTITFDVNSPYETPGIDFDQIVVGGDVNLSDATLHFFGGDSVPPDGQMVKLINHTSATPTIGSNTPGEGGFVGFGKAVFTVSYQGGDNNDLVLTKTVGAVSLSATLTGGKLTISDTLAAGRLNLLTYSLNEFDVVITDPTELFTAAPAGGQLVNGGHSITLPRAAITHGIVVNSGGGDDVLSIDLSLNKTPLPTGGIIFNGGTQATSVGDKLIIQGGTQGLVTYGYTSANDGSVTMSLFGKVTYSGLEQLADNGSATNVVVNLPLGPNDLRVGDDGIGNNGQGRLSAPTIVQTDFFSLPTGAVSINAGSVNDNISLTEGIDGNSAINIGTPAKPFNNARLTGSVALNAAFNLAAKSFTTAAGQSLAATGGTLSLGAGTLAGAISGGLGLAKVYAGDLTLIGDNSYLGETLVKTGRLILASTNGARLSTIRVETDFGLDFVRDTRDFTIGGLAGTGDVALDGHSDTTVNLRVGTNSSAYSGSLSGPGTLDKVGAGTLTLTGINTQSGTAIESGTLQVNSNRALGELSIPLFFTGGTLHASATFTSPRDIMLQSGGSGTFEASVGKTLTLSGVISGSGNFLIGATGTVVLTNTGNTNTGTTEISGPAPTVVNGVTITVPGGRGDIVITPGTTPNTIESIDLTATNVPVSLVVRSPVTGTVTVEKIISADTTLIKTISLGAGVILGDGAADSVPDLVINGKLTNLLLADVKANTIIQLGKGLAYTDTYKNNPNVTLRDVLGAGVVLDLSGAGAVAAGPGGGGLGRIVVNSWSAPGFIKTSQGIKSLLVKNGDANLTLEADPNHLGAATVANVGTVSIPNGSWIGTGLQVEGTVAQFLTKGLADGANISAGAFGTIKIKGNYAGSIVAKADSSVFVLVKGVPKVIATGAIASVSISGTASDFTGLMNTDGRIGGITLVGSGRFMGTVRAGSIGNISATSFTGTPGIDGVRKTITAIGTIGNITATTGGLTDYIIAAGTDLGSDAKFGGVADSFSSYTTNPLTGVHTIVSIGAVTIKGDVTGTTIAAGVNPGTGGIYGNGDDIVVARPAGLTTKTKIGAMKFALNNVHELAISQSADAIVSNAFEAQSMTSVQLGLGKTPTTLLKDFSTVPNHYIVSGSSAIIVRQLA